MDKGRAEARQAAQVRASHSAAFGANLTRIDPCMVIGAPVEAIDSPRRILVVKTQASGVEGPDAPVIPGSDADATAKALAALGYDESEIAWLRLGPCREAGETSLRMAVESIDPESILALDDESMVALCGALGVGSAAAGTLLWVQGRRLVGVGGFEKLLASPEGKQLAWSRIKLISPEGPVY